MQTEKIDPKPESEPVQDVAQDEPLPPTEFRPEWLEIRDKVRAGLTPESYADEVFEGCAAIKKIAQATKNSYGRVAAAFCDSRIKAGYGSDSTWPIIAALVELLENEGHKPVPAIITPDSPDLKPATPGGIILAP